jgi:hypothetical protein
MALQRATELGINEIYARKLKERQQKLTEATASSTNSIHTETERLIDELSGDEMTLSAEQLEEKLRDLEKLELTSLDKKVITAIRKNITIMAKAKEDFEKFTKGLKYEYVISKKNEPTEENAVEGEEPNPEAEEELKAGDENFKENPEGEEETVPVK